MSTLLAAIFLLGGVGFMLVAAIGLLRLPDLYTRMHAITKAGTLGIGLVLVGVALSFADLSVSTRAAAAILFVLLTAPVSAHMVGRASYLGGVPRWEGTVFDQWNGRFQDVERSLDATEANARERARPSSDEAPAEPA
jgi:multicomponent Na+:H+ antiporter subunit G